MLNIVAAKFLIETRVRLGGNLSYSDIGEKLFGRTGRILCEASIIGSQFTLVTAYVYFIVGTMQCIVYDAMIYQGIEEPAMVNKWIFGAIVFAIYVPLVWVRNMTKLASTHLFGDIMIILTVLFILGYAIEHVISKGHFNTKNEPAINTRLFPNAFGFSVFAFCGMGTVLPTYDVSGSKDNFFKILVYVCLTIMTIYIIFPLVTISAYGTYNRFTNRNGIQLLITQSLPQEQIVVWVIELLFCINLIFSYPLVICPANLVIENYLFKDWPKTQKRTWCTNLTRALMVLATVVTALVVWGQLNYFLSVAGAIACTPLCLILPSMFYYKAVAETKGEKRFVMSIIVLCTGLMIFCTIWGTMCWILYDVN